MHMPSADLWQIFFTGVTTSNLINEVKQQPCSVIEKPVSICPFVLLAFKVYSTLKAWSQPR